MSEFVLMCAISISTMLIFLSLAIMSMIRSQFDTVPDSQGITIFLPVILLLFSLFSASTP